MQIPLLMVRSQPKSVGYYIARDSISQKLEIIRVIHDPFMKNKPLCAKRFHSDIEYPLTIGTYFSEYSPEPLQVEDLEEIVLHVTSKRKRAQEEARRRLEEQRSKGS